MASNKELQVRARELAETLGISVDPKGNNEHLTQLVADLEAKVAEASLGDLESLNVDDLVNGEAPAALAVSASAPEQDEGDDEDDEDEPEATEPAPPLKTNPTAPDTAARRARERERERLIVAARADDGEPSRYVVAPGKAITSARGQILRGKETPGDTPDRVTAEDFMRRRSDSRDAAEARITELVERGYLVRE